MKCGMERIKIIFNLSLLLFIFSANFVEASAPKFVATFNSLGLYWNPGEGSSANDAQVKYRIAGSGIWNDAYPLWFDSRNNEYRGSIVKLLSGTDYEVQITLLSTNSSITFKASTWSEQFPIATTIELPENSNQTLVLSQSGTANGYILYTPGSSGNATIDTQNLFEMNIEVRASYVIIRGLMLKNAGKHAIRIFNNATDVVIENNDISGWGVVESDGWGANYDSAVFANSAQNVERVIIQRNTFHDPRSDSNAWDEFRSHCDQATQTQCHPRGPQVITMFDTEGNHVIRYNTISSGEDNYFNDVFGAGSNFSNRGFPNRDSDIYGNYIERAWDDGIESEGANQNVRIWGNYIDKTMVKIAIAATSQGPLYIWRNIGNTSRWGATSTDSDTNLPSGYGRGVFIKAGGQFNLGSGRTYIFHNTVLQKTAIGKLYPLGSSGGMSANGEVLDNVITRNNIMTNWKTWWTTFNQTHCSQLMDFDFDLYNGKIAQPDSACNVMHETNGIKLDSGVYPTFVSDTGAGEYTLMPNSSGIDDGLIIPNFNDAYKDSLPDIGAFETGMPDMEFGVNAYLLVDTDEDGIFDDGDMSGIVGDNQCTGGATVNCDDNCPLNTNSGQIDIDNDSYGDICDAFPTDGAEQSDTDSDGLGNNIDNDDDNDGLIDAQEILLNTDQLFADTDNDSVNDGLEVAAGTDPLDSASFPQLNDGDANNDGIVNTADLIIAMQILLEQRVATALELSHLDVAPLVAGVPSPDNEFNVADLLLIQRKVLGLVNF